jgi:nucleoside-diphosphate-sugar epimerase
MVDNTRPNACSGPVALTGAGGFVGSRILHKLLDHGFLVKALRFQRNLPDHDNLEKIPGNINDPASLRELVAGTKAVVHCGGLVSARSAREFFKINSQGTANLIEALTNLEAPRLLYISSLAAREPQLSPYAASKNAAEKILAESLLRSWDVLRPPAVYGPGDLQLLPLLRLLKHRVGVLPAGRQARVSVVYVDDLADAVCDWLEQGGAKNKIYEIADGQVDGYTWQALLSEAARLMNVRPVYFSPPFVVLRALVGAMTFVSRGTGQIPFLSAGKLRELTHQDWVCHSDELQHDVGWSAQTDFQVGIEKTLRWYQHEGMISNMNLDRVP